jgi:hypothetical protein
MTATPAQGIKTVLHPVTGSEYHVGGGRLVATVTDPDGNVPGLLQGR